MIRAAVLCVAATIAGSPAAPAEQAGTLRIAAASDLQAVFKPLVDRFQRESGETAVVTFGSSGAFFAQISNGAPFDLFFSADLEYPTRLVSTGLAEPGTMYEYASGRLALWSRSDAHVDVSRGLAVLSTPAVKRIAIANPEHAPYGRAAVAALKRQGLYDAVQPKLVLGENISQAAQFVFTGNAEAGIVALSLVLAPPLRDTGAYWLVPSELHDPLRQAAVVIRASQRKDAARRFLDFVRTPESVALLRQYGLERARPADSVQPVVRAE